MHLYRIHYPDIFVDKYFSFELLCKIGWFLHGCFFKPLNSSSIKGCS